MNPWNCPGEDRRGQIENQRYHTPADPQGVGGLRGYLFTGARVKITAARVFVYRRAGKTCARGYNFTGAGIIIPARVKYTGAWVKKVHVYRHGYNFTGADKIIPARG